MIAQEAQRTPEQVINACLTNAIEQTRTAIVTLGIVTSHAYGNRDPQMVKDSREWTVKLGAVLQDMAEVLAERDV